MSTQADTSLASLKALTTQIVGIISSTQQIPAGNAHMALSAQVIELVAQVFQDYSKGPYLPGIVCSCSKELMRVRAMRPQVWPNWHSIGHDDPWLLKHSWHEKVLAWEVLGDHSCDLPVSTPPSLGPIPVELPSPPIIAGNVAGPSTTMDNEFRVVAKDEGKGMAVLEPARVKSTWIAKSQEFMESENDEVPFIQPISKGVLEVILPQHSSFAERMSRLPHSPHLPCSPKKQSFGPASCTARSCLGALPTSGSGLEVAKPP
ncbi:hypothetical protein BDR04DRAFT_1163106 [Suillus decipiens]|nr:hypothetical protein BDR04DRAFT_1163106 [Suillus decipiens]